MQKRRAFGYCRVSSEKQAKEGDSLEIQRRVIEAICVAEGYDLAAIHAEPGISGSVPFAEREQGKALLAAVGSGDIIVCLKLDRAFRNSADALATLEHLQRRNVGLYLKDMGGDVSASNVSALMFTMLSAFATFERSRIGERIGEAKKYQRQQGRFMGGDTPFGFRKIAGGDGKLYVEPVEAIHVEAKRLKTQGYSTRLAAGHFAQRGHKVSASGVRALWQTLTP